jgi:DNA-binding transcriptional MerR regulator
MKAKTKYTAREVRKILDLSQRKLDYWDDLGIVSPVRSSGDKGSKNKGRGVERLYTFDDLIRLKLVRDLRTTGLSLQRIQKGLKKLRKRTLDSDPIDEMLVTDGKTFQRIRKDGKIEDMLANGQLMFGIVSLASLEQNVRERIVRFNRGLEKKNVAS